MSNLRFYKANFFLSDRAFTLIELLVTLAIIAILAVIAVGNFQEFKARGNDATASQDVRTLATSEEAYFVDHEAYLSCTDRDDCISKFEAITTFSDNVVISATEFSTYFVATSASSLGSGRTFTWSSEDGLSHN